MEQLLKYGLKNNVLVHIDAVSNGLSCGCVCPSCGGVLEAHQGKKNQHHFKHYRIADCNHGSESALHIMAKNIIADTKLVYIPNAPSTVFDLNPKGKCYKFERSFLEKCIPPDIRCDVLLEYKDVVLNVEIKVTHEVDFSKKLKLYNANLRTIEIDLSNFVDNFDEFKIKKIIESGEKTQLIYSPKARDIYAKWYLGNWKEICRDRSGFLYTRCHSFKEIMDSLTDYHDVCLANECYECSDGKSFNPNQKFFLCLGLYGDLNYKCIDKILDIIQKDNSVQHVELIVGEEKRTYDIDSICPHSFDSIGSKYPPPKIGMKLLHATYGELTIVGIEKGIIEVIDSNGEKSHKVWDTLLRYKIIKII